MTERLSRRQIAWCAARDLAPGQYVNLGLGLPVLVAAMAPPGRGIVFHSENGVVGVGPLAGEGEADPDLVDAGSQAITLEPGAVVVDSVEAFAMIRGGHLDVTLLGGYQVAANGDLANWDSEAPAKGQLVGGAMDLAAGARSVRVLMAHTTRDGEPRLVSRCTLPLTGLGVVDRVYTDLAIVDRVDGAFVVREHLRAISREALQACTGAPLEFAADCRYLEPPAD